MSSISVSSILEKMNNRDRDFRYMACSDLLAEVQKETFKLSNEDERKLVGKLLDLLDDSSNDVQGLSVKCIGSLLRKIQDAQIQNIIEKSLEHLLKPKQKPELRDISALALKTVIEEAPAKSSALLGQKLTPSLIRAVQPSSEAAPEVIEESLEILNDLLRRFGSQLTSYYDEILGAVQPRLTSTRATSRKRAISCIGQLSLTLPDKTFNNLIGFLIKSIEESSKADHIRSFIQCFGTISNSAGFRLGKYLDQIAPIVTKYCNDERFEQDDELREHCFQTFEALILRCPREMTPHLATVIKLSLEYVKYDPNYEAESDDEDGEAMDTSDNEDEGSDADDDEDYSDDDDMSWKVRRASIKCLAAIINTRPEMLRQLHEKVAPALVRRFKEREENVKLDVFSTFVDLLRQTGFAPGSIEDPQSPFNLLRASVPVVVKSIAPQLKQKSIKTRVGAFTLLRELVTVSRGGLGEYVAAIVPGVQFTLNEKEKNSNVKIEALGFLRVLLASHPGKVFQPHFDAITKAIIKSVSDTYYKTIAEALRAGAELVKALRPNVGGASEVNYKPFVKPLYDATFEKLKAQDIDQEVKESVINCMGLIVARLGDELAAELKTCLAMLVDRLNNEITRLVTVKAFGEIAISPLHIDLKPVIAETVKQHASFLRKANRQLKQASLVTLDRLTRAYGGDMKGEQFEAILNELAPLLSEDDLHLSQLAFRLTTSVIHAQPSTVGLVQEKLYPKVLRLVESSLLQGHALDAVLDMYAELVLVDAKSFGFDALLDSLLGLVKKPLNQSQSVTKQSYAVVAKCIAALTAAAKSDKRAKTVERFIDEIKKAKGESGKQLALLCLGEIGRRADLASQASELQKVISSCFDSESEETRAAASFALGNVAVGNLGVFLPFVLGEIKSQPKRQYLLLLSLREIISRCGATEEGIRALAPNVSQILGLLFDNTESEEEGTRNVVAESLGRLAIGAPNEIITALREKLTSPSPNARSTAVSALKFAIVEKPTAVDAVLQPHMGSFLALLKDPDHTVRRAALLTFNYAAHNKPNMIRGLLNEYLGVLYGETKIKPELIREVSLGPFKHKLDDGLEVRKAAFECMYTLMNSCFDKLVISDFLANLAAGLSDPSNDIKMLCHLMIIRLCQTAGAALIQGADSLVEPLNATVTSKVKEGAVKQEIDSNEQLIRSGLRTIAAISKIPNLLDSSPKFDNFIKTTLATPELKEKFEVVLAETESKTPGSGAEPMDTSA